MGLDLGKIVHSALFGFFIFGVFLAGYVSMGASHGVGIDGNSSMDVNATFQTAKLLEEKIQSEGTDKTNTFFPAVGTLFDVWELVKATVADLGQSMQIFITKLGGGQAMTTLVSIIVVLMGLSIAFIVLAGLFKLGGFKEK